MRVTVVLFTVAVLGCQPRTNLFESGVPGSSGYVEANAPPVEKSLQFVTGRADREGAYDAIATFPAAEFPAFEVREVLANGRKVPYFSVHNSTVWSRMRRANGRDDLVVHARTEWKPGSDVTLEVSGLTASGEPVRLTVSGRAPPIVEKRAGVRFAMPDKPSPTYRIITTVPGEYVPEGRIERLEANGVECRDYQLTQGGREIYDRRTKAGQPLGITARFDWRARQKVTLTVIWENGEREWRAEGTAGEPGWWHNDWNYYAGVMLEETAGLTRQGEPVHVTLGLFADRLTAPAREIRVVTYAPNDARADERGYVEVASQVYNVKTWKDEEILAIEERDEKTGQKIPRYSPTTTLEVAFLADVPSYRKQAYLIFYGNPHAAKPSYQTDLVVQGEGLGCTVENEFYKINHAGNSGAIFGVYVKQGVDVLLEHKLETNGAVQWNPDCYSPPHSWVHASDWENPECEIVAGPVFVMLRRWAPLPHLEDVLASSTNIYYAGQPYVIVSETAEFTRDRYVKAVRQAEIVFNHAVLDEFAYIDPFGAIKGFKIEGSRPHPEHAIELPLDTPWMAFINRERRVAFGHVALEAAASNLTGGLPRLDEDAYFYVANGPWIYLSRALVYPFGSNNASRMTHVPKGAVYVSKTAYLPIRLAEGSDPFEPIETARRTLTKPLHVWVHHDTDPRTPKGWVVPILVEPFDEGVEDAIGGAADEKEDEE